jgi:spore germination cell wall hydrolase CwlJ-like protein
LTRQWLARILRVFTPALALTAAAFVLFVTLQPAMAQGTVQVADVTPADLTPDLAAAREALAVPSQPRLTPEVLANYVARQQAAKAFTAFDVPQTGSLTNDMLSAYVESHSNPALRAIDGLQAAAPKPSLTPDMVASYASRKFVPTFKKVTLANKERLCLTQAIYHEARGESENGQWAVANVIINRAMSKRYPTTMCGVIYQGCQFSFACDGRSDMGTERQAWNRANRIADAAFGEFQHGQRPDVLPKSAMFYHAKTVNPGWSNTYHEVAAIGGHVFYSPL